MKQENIDCEALIVGTGFGGMGAAIQLKKMGITSIIMLDRESDLGGTWHINRYPGLAVDIASVSYSYSFEQNPYWTQRYCSGPEIKAYADRVADKYKLRKHMRFNTVVKRAVYDEAGKFWTVYPVNSDPIKARLLIPATGLLSQPQYPEIEGIRSFSGKIIHTAAWDSSYDFRGKRTAVIGTGASAVQAIPIIAKAASNLTVFQRTAIWVYPKSNPSISPKMQSLYARFPWVQRLAKFCSDTLLETLMVTAILHAKQIPFMIRMAEKSCREHLERQVKDPVVKAKLTPTYSFGCKRPTFSNDYFPTFNRGNVELVTESIARVEPDAVVTSDGRRHQVDALIVATGFNLWKKGNFPAFEVLGVGGEELGDRWRRTRYRSFEGITVPGFPNLFNLHSPYSYSGFCYFNGIEMQMKHMERCIGEMKRLNARSFEVTAEAEERFMRQMTNNAKSTVLAVGSCSTANSYYFNPHGESSLLRLTSARSGMDSAKKYPLNSYIFSA